MDKVDVKILQILEQHGRYSVQRIAKASGIPITTVHYRLRKLEEEGIISGYTIKLNYEKIGYGISAYVLVVVDYNILRAKNITQQKLAEKLLQMKWVESATIIAGRFDMILRLYVPKIEDLNQFIVLDLRNVEGIERTETIVVLNDLGKQFLQPVIPP